MSDPSVPSPCPNPHTDDPGQHSEISPLLSMVFFNFSAQEDQIVETHYSPRLPWPSGDMEVEVLLRGQHIYIPGICNRGAIRLCGPHPDGFQPRPAISCGTPQPASDAARSGLLLLLYECNMHAQTQVKWRGGLFQAQTYSIIGHIQRQKNQNTRYNLPHGAILAFYVPHPEAVVGSPRPCPMSLLCRVGAQVSRM